MEDDTGDDVGRVLWDMGLSTIKELETDAGILASGRDEAYGCIFGRDSLITVHKLLQVYDAAGDEYFLRLAKKVLVTLASLQGKEANIESGEEPGKCIHEFRPTGHEHLTSLPVRPWFVYPDKALRNYDSVDSTPLYLIVLHDTLARSADDPEFAAKMLPSAKAALDWLLMFGDSNGDGFIDYRFHPDRKFGGLETQSWMDSSESVFHEDGAAVAYPVAPVEVQAYAWLALKLWSRELSDADPAFSGVLEGKMAVLRAKFERHFLAMRGGVLEVACGIDGNGKKLESVRSSMGHLLWASVLDAFGVAECILDPSVIPALVDRLMKPDLFEPEAGLRTLSSGSHRFDPQSYHNGSIWPHDNSMIIEGLSKFGYHEEAAKMRRAILSAFEHFRAPIELYAFSEGSYREYLSPSGRGSCKKQAWSAAAILRELASERKR